MKRAAFFSISNASTHPRDHAWLPGAKREIQLARVNAENPRSAKNVRRSTSHLDGREKDICFFKKRDHGLQTLGGGVMSR